MSHPKASVRAAATAGREDVAAAAHLLGHAAGPLQTFESPLIPPENDRKPVPILLYRGVTRNGSHRMAPFTVTPDDFAAHMDALVERGYECLTVSQFIGTAEFAGKRDFADRNVALVTFDDGYASFLEHALPILRQRSLTATLYLTSGWLEGGTAEPVAKPHERFLSWGDVPDIAAEGIEVGTNSHGHFQLDTLDAPGLLYELLRSKSLIEDALGQPVRSLAYPEGYNSALVRRLARETQFDSAAAVRNMFSHTGDDPMRLARLEYRSDLGVDDVRDWLDWQNAPMATSGDGVATRGSRAYRRLKAIVRGRPGTGLT